MKRTLHLLILVLVSIASSHLWGQHAPRTVISDEDWETAMESFYKALKNQEWPVIASYCMMTADSDPQRYYYIQGLKNIKAEAVWRKLRSFSVSYTDPKTGLKPNEAELIIGSFDVPKNVETAGNVEGGKRVETFYSMGQIRMDLWVKMAGKWRVIPEFEISHKSALQINNVPFEGRGLGNQFETLAEIEARAKADQKKDASMQLSVRENVLAIETQFQKIYGNKELTDDQKRDALREVIEKSAGKMRKTQEEYMDSKKIEMQKGTPAGTGAKSK